MNPLPCISEVSLIISILMVAIIGLVLGLFAGLNIAPRLDDEASLDGGDPDKPTVRAKH